MLKVRFSKRTHSWLTSFALLFFFCGIFWSLYEIREFQVRIFSLQSAALILSVPLMLHLSVRRFQAVSDIYEAKYSYISAARIVVYGGVANVLPVPGAFMVRVASLANQIGMRKAIFANLVAYIGWVFVSVFFVCLAQTRIEWYFSGIALLASSFLLVVLFVFKTGGRGGAVFEQYKIQLFLTLSNVLRLFLISYCLGASMSVELVTLVQLSGVIVSGLGVVPSGIGIAESAGAAIAVALGELAQVGFAVVAINRILTWAGLLAVVIWLKCNED